MNTSEIEKLRRFALTIGLILLTYSLAEVELDSPASISPLGIKLNIKQPELLGFGIFLSSVYALLRYWYYAILIGVSPRKARKRLLSGSLSDGSNFAESLNGFSELARKEIGTYFPILKLKKKIDFDVSSYGDQQYIIKFSPPFYSKMLTLIQDFDYYAPVILNVISVAISLFNWF